MSFNDITDGYAMTQAQKAPTPPPSLEQLVSRANAAIAENDFNSAGAALSSLASQFRGSATGAIQKIVASLAEQSPVAAAQALSRIMNQPLEEKLLTALVYEAPGLLTLLGNDKVRENTEAAIETARLAAILTWKNPDAQLPGLQTLVELAPKAATLTAIEAFRTAATLAPDSQKALRDQAIDAWKALVQKLEETDPSRATRVARTAESLAPQGSRFAAIAGDVKNEATNRLLAPRPA